MNKIDKKVRIGIFFDGTGNNAQNAFKREHEKENVSKSSSYHISPTNVYRLFRNYTQNNSEQIKAFYIDGIGTLAHSDDSSASAATGYDIWEGYSANAKTQKAFDFLCSYIEEIAVKNYNKPLALDITIDLFGFSRGAALARNFANLIFEKKCVFEQILKNEKHQLTNLNLGFIGLFDTVESIQFSHLNLSLKNIKPIGVFHITALHECRENFPLTSVFSDKTYYGNADKIATGFHPEFDYFEMQLPGAHSDIGGGYNADEREVKTINLKATYTEEGAKKDAFKIIKDNPNFKSVLKNLSYKFELKSAGYNTISTRDSVKGHLQYVYAYLMLDVAIKYGVPFNQELFNQTYIIPKELDELLKCIQTQKEFLLTKQKISGTLNESVQNYESVLENYVHLSVSTRTIFGSEDHGHDGAKEEPLLKSSGAQSSFSNPTKHVIINRPTFNWLRIIKFQ